MDTYNASELVALTNLPPYALALAAAAGVVAVWLSFRGTRGAPMKVRLGLLAARAAFALGLFALLLEPGQRLMAKSREANRVVIAVDVSESMALTDGGSTTRMRQALDAARALEQDLRGRSAPFVPELYAFDERAMPLAPSLVDDLATGARRPEGRGTRLLAALEAVGTGEGERPLGGVVIISDGADTTGLDTGLSNALREEARRLGVPVHTVVTGSAAGFKDVAIERVIADDFAFVRNKVTVQVRVRHTGFPSLELPFSLKENGKPLLVQREVLSDGDETQVQLTFEPKAAGKHVYTISVPVHPEEGIAENNRVDFTLKVIRDRIRVLQVAGRPSWDERFVRRLLKENPSVDLISFFILRSPTDVAGAPSNELSLIPFPTRELFTEELHTFDVVIFQDFNYRPYQMGLYLQNVKEFVEEAGGGFMMIGGELAFSEGDYEGTPIADVLPVRLLPGRGHLSTERFTPLLTEAGKSHPITDLGDTTSGKNPYAELPPLEGLNLVMGLAEGAEALLAHPFLNAGDRAAPVVATREVGKGRSLAVLTDSTWLWSLPHVGAGGRGDAHRRFFANALRWLIRDPELSRVKVNVGKASVAPDEDVPLEVRSYDASYRPEGGATLEVKLVALDAEGSEQREHVLKGETGGDGIWRATFTPPRTGAWRVSATADKDGRRIGSDENAFIVRAAKNEVLHAEPRPDVLEAIASATGGTFTTARDITDLRFFDHGIEKVHRQKTEPLWHHWLPLVLVVLAGCLEWYWRRRRGFA